MELVIDGGKGFCGSNLLTKSLMRLRLCKDKHFDGCSMRYHNPRRTSVRFSGLPAGSRPPLLMILVFIRAVCDGACDFVNAQGTNWHRNVVRFAYPGGQFRNSDKESVNYLFFSAVGSGTTAPGDSPPAGITPECSGGWTIESGTRSAVRLPRRRWLPRAKWGRVRHRHPRRAGR